MVLHKCTIFLVNGLIVEDRGLLSHIIRCFQYYNRARRQPFEHLDGFLLVFERGVLNQRFKVAMFEEFLQFTCLYLFLRGRMYFLLNLHVQSTQRYTEHMRQVLVVLPTLILISEGIDCFLTV